jgi:hypothetical protein
MPRMVTDRLRVGGGRCEDDPKRDGPEETDWMCHEGSPFARHFYTQSRLIMRRRARKVNERWDGQTSLG